jgi:16S rRNA processing protein RimM
MVTVGRIARTHGLRGDVIVNPETDFVEERFRRGAVVWIHSPNGDEALTIAASRIQGGRPVLTFEGIASIDDAERITGQELRIPEDALQPLPKGAYYLHQLVGCMVETVAGERIGEVGRVDGGAGSSQLVVERGAAEVLIPLAEPICVEVNVVAKKIVIAPPDGLLELNEVGHRHDLSANGRGGSRGRGRQSRD